jgi:hypothetical protein
MNVIFRGDILCIEIQGDPIKTLKYFRHVAAIVMLGDGRGTAVRSAVSRIAAKAGAEAIMYAVFPRHHVRSSSFRDAAHQRGQ